MPMKSAFFSFFAKMWYTMVKTAIKTLDNDAYNLSELGASHLSVHHITSSVGPPLDDFEPEGPSP